MRKECLHLCPLRLLVALQLLNRHSGSLKGPAILGAEMQVLALLGSRIQMESPACPTECRTLRLWDSMAGSRMRWRKRHDFIELAVEKFHGDLNLFKIVFARELDGRLGLLKIEGFEGISRPLPLAAEEELSANILQQNSHTIDRNRLRRAPAIGNLSVRLRRPNPD